MEKLAPDADHLTGIPNPRLLAEAGDWSLVVHALQAETRNMSLEEYRSALADKSKELVASALQTGGVFTRTTPVSLEKILADGEFKTTYDTGQKGKGGVGAKKFAEYLERRQDIESVEFGYPTARPKRGESRSDLLKREATNPRPLYGYLSADSKGRITEQTSKGKDSDDWLDPYGSVAVRLKSGIHERTTITHGDSMAKTFTFGTSAPVRLLEPTYHFARPNFDPDGKTVSEARKQAREYAEKTGDFLSAKSVDDNIVSGSVAGGMFNKGYVEAQIHKRVKVTDIDKVVFAAKPSPKIRGLLEKQGIPWEIAG